MTVHTLNTKQRKPREIPREELRLRAPKMTEEDRETVKAAVRASLIKRNGQWLYMPGHNDATVAHQCDVTPVQVGIIRRCHYGPMRRGRPAGSRTTLNKEMPLMTRVELLERIVKLLCTKVYPKAIDNLQR